MSITNNSQVFFHWIAQKEMFHELILAQDGRIYPTLGLEKAADWSLVYYNGNICVHQGDDMYCVGSLPKEVFRIPTAAGETSFHSIEDSGCLLHSNQPVLEEETSVFAVFRYQDLLGLYMADSMVSRGIYFALMEYTPEDEALYGKLFQQMVSRHDPEAAEKVTAWMKHPAANGKEV